MKSQYCSQRFNFRLNCFVLHLHIGLNLEEGDKKKKVSELAEVVFVSSSHAVISTRRPADYQNLECASCHIPYTAAYEYCCIDLVWMYICM